MATKLPLVMTNGLIQQLQSGDTINAPTSTTSVRTFTNGESSAALVIGTPVYISAADTAKRAQANAMSTSGVIGVWYDASTAAAGSGQCAVGGTLAATTVQWDAVAGTSGGLTAGTLYFLDPATPGKITSTAPTTVGQVVVSVGRASSTTELELQISEPILL